MKYLSTFSGIGGFELGIIKAYEQRTRLLHNKPEVTQLQTEQDVGGNNINELQRTTTCIGFSEIDKYAIQIYQKHFPEHKQYGDITKINTDELPDFDLLVGGFPCQAFSIAGKRRGFEDTRGTLFFELARILRAKRPRLFVFENVKGLLSHDGGQTFRTIIATLDELGYDLQWQVLNSKNHGVPQNRERVFIVGHLRGTSRPQVFPFGETDTVIIKTKELSEPISNCLRTNYSNGHSNETYIRQLNNPTHSNNRLYGEDGISPALNTAQGGNRQPKITVPVLTPDRLEKRQNGRRFKEDGEESFTLTGQDRHGVYNGLEIRRLTPTECERLQGFPDGWTEGISDSQRYKCLGNAVTVNVIADIIERLITPLPIKTNDMKGKKEKIKCPFCGKEKEGKSIICPCEVAPKYDPDYEEWRNK